MFYEDFVSNKKRLYDYYAGIFAAFSYFETALKTLTKDPYSSMVIKNIGGFKCLEDTIFWNKV